MTKFPLLFLVVVFGCCCSLALSSNHNNPYQGFGDSAEDNNVEDDSLERLFRQLKRSKRGGYIQQKKINGYAGGAIAGGHRYRGPAAHYGAGYSAGGAAKRPVAYGGSYGGGGSYGIAAGPSYTSYGTGGGSVPGPSSLYSYAPRRANAAVYGGIHGPQTSEEALKFDTHLTRSMIADAISSSVGGLAGRRLYAGHGGVIQAAVQSRRQVQFYDVPSSHEVGEPLTIEVGASPASQLNIKFKSASSHLNVEQDHEPAPGSVRETSSEDEPHRLIHTVTRPIFQEIHEVIKPFRKVTQEIQPVQEDIQTVVAKGEGHGQGAAIGSIQVDDSSEFGGSSGQQQQQIQQHVSGGTGRGGSIPQAIHTTVGSNYGPTGHGAIAGLSAGQKQQPYQQQPSTGSYSGGINKNYGGSAASGPVYSGGYVKPAPLMSYSGPKAGVSYATGSGSHGSHGGEINIPFSQVQIPFRSRAKSAAAAARRA